MGLSFEGHDEKGWKSGKSEKEGDRKVLNKEGLNMCGSSSKQQMC